MKILCVLPLVDEQKRLLEAALPSAEIQYAAPGDPAPSNIGDMEVIVGNIKLDTLRAAKNLKLLQLNTVGTAAYGQPGAMPEGALLCNASGAYGVVVSEFMLAGLLGLYKNLPLYRDRQREGVWKGIGEMRMVSGSTVLIVGLGDIGNEFAKRVKVMGAQVIGLRVPLGEKPEHVDEQYLPDALDTVLPRADVVALCLPGTAENRFLINAARLALMKPTAVLLNTARGNIVDQDALLDALRNNRLSGAFIDVTEPEPLPPEHPLWQQENVILTPHVAGAYSDWFYRMPLITENVLKLAVANIGAFLAGKELRNVVK